MLRTRKILAGAYEVLNTGAFRYRVSTKNKSKHGAGKWDIYKAGRTKGAKWELIDDDFTTKKEAVDWALNYAEDDNKKLEAEEKGDSVGFGDYEKQELNTRVMAK